MSNKKAEQLYTGKSTNFESDYIDLEDHERVSVQVATTNGSNFSATCTLQLSNDYDHWVDVNTASAIMSGATDVKFFDTDTGAAYVRLKVIFTTGSADFELDWVMK